MPQDHLKLIWSTRKLIIFSKKKNLFHKQNDGNLIHFSKWNLNLW